MFTNLCVVAATQLIITKHKDIFCESIWASGRDITLLTGKFVKMPKKSSIFDHIFLDGHKASFDNFSILLMESNPFKLKLRESLLISSDELILNKNCYSFLLELFGWLWHCYLIFIAIFLMPCQYINII